MSLRAHLTEHLVSHESDDKDVLQLHVLSTQQFNKSTRPKRRISHCNSHTYSRI